jgi:hypothetical protein
MDGSGASVARGALDGGARDLAVAEAALIAGLYADLNAGRLESFIERLSPEVDFVPLPLFRWSRCQSHDDVRSWWPKRRELQIEIGIERIARDADGRYGIEGSVAVGGVESRFAGIVAIEAGRVAYLRHYFSDLATLSGLGEWSPSLA